MKRFMQKKINLAIISPNENAYSETFIQAHRNLLDGNTHYYFGGTIPTKLEGEGLLIDGYLEKAKYYGLNLLSFSAQFTVHEYVLKRSFAKNKINVVLAEYGIVGAAVVNVCRAMNIPLIVHFHGYDASNQDVLELYSAKYKEMFRYAEKVVVVSNVMLDSVSRLGCPTGKIKLNVYGPDEDFFSINNDYKSRTLLTLGRFVDKKAPYYTILAFAKVLKEHPDAKLVMAGNGELLNTCKNLSRYLGVADSVNFAGIAGPDRVRELMGSSIAFLQHSVTAENGDMEGTPVAILEAGAAGLAVISTRHAGIPDVVVEGRTGFLVDEHDVDGMAKHIKELLSVDGRARVMGQHGRRHIRDNFTMQKHIGALNTLIKEAVG